MTSPYFGTSLEHILAELERLDRLIQLQVWRLRTVKSFDDRFQGLYITEEDVDTLLDQPIGYPAWQKASTVFQPEHFEQAQKELTSSIKHQKAESKRQQIVLRLDELAHQFGLDAIDVDLLLIALAPEIDLRYEKLYGYLQDDVTRKRPSINLALNLLSAGGVEKLKLRSHLAPTSPLLNQGLIQLTQDPHQTQAAQLSHGLQVHPAILQYLLELPGLEPSLQTCCQWSAVDQTVPDLPLKPNARKLLQHSIERLHRQQSGCIYLQGEPGLSQSQAAAAIAHALNLTLLTVDLVQVATTVAPADFVSWWRSLTLTVWQHQALLYINGLDALLSPEHQPFSQQLYQALKQYPQPFVVTGQASWPFMAEGIVPAVILFEVPDFELRQQIWERTLHQSPISISDTMLIALSDRFRLRADQIHAAVTQATQTLEHLPEGTDLNPTLFEAARIQTGEHHLNLARKVTPRFTWEDIILLPEQITLLKALCDQVIHRPQVYGDWGFGRKLVLGKGISALFAGPPGTGKTMAAEVIAHTLQLDLYKIDLSQVVNKYIGETEKNLSRIFDAAEQSNAILLFDEADALFGKRSEVKDAHDRYANLEVAYLLQKMEEYEGITILTTNLRQNLDEAFTRRIRFVVEFPFPEEAQRLKIWQTIWPTEMELSTTLDFQRLAREFKLAGGNIRNIALSAAFLAAADTGTVTWPHLLQATRQELHKMGRLVSPEVFSRLSGEQTP